MKTLERLSSYNMTALQLAESLLLENNVGGATAYWPSANTSARAMDIVNKLLEEEPVAIRRLWEARVYRSKRSRVWIATYTGSQGGQVWRSTHLTDYDQALALARGWEAEARAERLRLGRPPKKPILRVLGQQPGLTQKEVGMLMNLSERAVREIEKRAIAKLLNNPVVRKLWQDYSSGDLNEEDFRLTAAEIEALFSLTRTSMERLLMQKVVDLVQA